MKYRLSIHEWTDKYKIPTSSSNVSLSAIGKAVSPPSSTSFRKYNTVKYLENRSITMLGVGY
jgi:hypothetical protein